MLASSMPSEDVGFVERAEGRFMGDENVGLFWNQRSMLLDLHQHVSGENPVAAHGVDGRSPELQPFERVARILQADGFSKVSSRQLWLVVEEPVMIACDDDFVPKGDCLAKS